MNHQSKENSNLNQLILHSSDATVKEQLHAWIEAKKIKDSDLVFTQLLQNDLQWKLFLKACLIIIEFRFSYSESLKYLELITDLILMGHDEAIFEYNFDQNKWTAHLQNLRYPQTSQRDDHLKNRLEKLPWPYGSKTKFERRGDRAGIELKMFITSEADLIKAISALERVKEQIRES